MQILIIRCVLCPSPNPGCTDNHDKNSAAINNRYLDFVQTRCLLSLINDNHEDNNLKEMFVFEYDPQTRLEIKALFDTKIGYINILRARIYIYNVYIYAKHTK